MTFSIILLCSKTIMSGDHNVPIPKTTTSLNTTTIIVLLMHTKQRG